MMNDLLIFLFGMAVISAFIVFTFYNNGVGL